MEHLRRFQTRNIHSTDYTLKSTTESHKSLPLVRVYFQSIMCGIAQYVVILNVLFASSLILHAFALSKDYSFGARINRPSSPSRSLETAPSSRRPEVSSRSEVSPSRSVSSASGAAPKKDYSFGARIVRPAESAQTSSRTSEVSSSRAISSSRSVESPRSSAPSSSGGKDYSFGSRINWGAGRGSSSDSSSSSRSAESSRSVASSRSVESSPRASASSASGKDYSFGSRINWGPGRGSSSAPARSVEVSARSIDAGNRVVSSPRASVADAAPARSSAPAGGKDYSFGSRINWGNRSSDRSSSGRSEVAPARSSSPRSEVAPARSSSSRSEPARASASGPAKDYSFGARIKRDLVRN